jgi:hypothetical protein
VPSLSRGLVVQRALASSSLSSSPAQARSTRAVLSSTSLSSLAQPASLAPLFSIFSIMPAASYSSSSRPGGKDGKDGKDQRGSNKPPPRDKSGDMGVFQRFYQSLVTQWRTHKELQENLKKFDEEKKKIMDNEAVKTVVSTASKAKVTPHLKL